MIELNKVYNENCLETMKNIPDDFIDLIVTSPPYDDLRVYDGYSFEFEKIAKEFFRIIKKGGVLIWVVGDATKKGSETTTSFKQALFFVEIGFNLHDTMIYKKENYAPLNHKRYEQCFEYMFAFSKGRPSTFNPKMIPCKHPGKEESYGIGRRQNFGSNHSMRVYSEKIKLKTKSHKIHPNIFSYTVGKEKTGHPAPFPENLALDQILSWSNERDLIYDPFGGSGTVAKACHKLKRNWILSEISDKYCKLIYKNISPVITQNVF